MAFCPFFIRSLVVTSFVVLSYGCSSVTSDNINLDCNDRYTRCASKVDAVEMKQFKEPQAVSKAPKVSSVASESSQAKIAVSPVLFGFDEGTAVGLDLNDVVVFLNSFPNASLTLHGYTDPIGSDDYNMALSYRRADYIRERLLMSGVSKQQIFVKPHGENNLLVSAPEEPLASRDSLKSMYAPNRRVEFEFKVSNASTLSN